MANDTPAYQRLEESLRLHYGCSDAAQAFLSGMVFSHAHPEYALAIVREFETNTDYQKMLAAAEQEVGDRAWDWILRSIPIEVGR